MSWLIRVNLIRLISVTIIILTLGSCSETSKSVDHKLEISRYKWMAGNWNLTTDPAIWEFWEIDSTELRGVSIFIKGGDSSILEEMKIYWKDTAFVFVADVAANEAPVEFYLVKKEANRMRFRNPEHDFPKEIWWSQESNATLGIELSNGIIRGLT